MFSSHLAGYAIVRGRLEVKWSDPERWREVIAHSGGMHIVISFIGCIGNLLKGSVLKELLGTA